MRVRTLDLDDLSLQRHRCVEIVHALQTRNDELLMGARRKDLFLRAAEEEALEASEKLRRVEPDLDLHFSRDAVRVDDPSGLHIFLHVPRSFLFTKVIF